MIGFRNVVASAGPYANRSRQITTPKPHHWIFFTNRMLFLTSNQQCQSTEGTVPATSNKTLTTLNSLSNSTSLSLTEELFGGQTCVGQEASIRRECTLAPWQIRLNDPYAAAMWRPYVKLLWTLIINKAMVQCRLPLGSWCTMDLSGLGTRRCVGHDATTMTQQGR